MRPKVVQSSHLCLTSCSPVISNMGTWVAQWHLAQGKMCILKLPFLPLMIPRLNGEQVSKLLWVITLIRPQLIRGRTKNKRSAVVENQSRGPGRRTKRCHRVPERKKAKIKEGSQKFEFQTGTGGQRSLCWVIRLSRALHDVAFALNVTLLAQGWTWLH